MFQPQEPIRLDSGRALRRLDRLFATIVAASIGLGFVLGLALSSARGEERAYHFNLYHGARGAPLTEMKWALRAGPFPLPICYAVAALNISALNSAYPDKDFAGGCIADERLGLRVIADRAMGMLEGSLP